MTIASSTLSDTTPAALEFALLQSWLASSSALQLPFHQIESQQQGKGREVQRLLLQAHLQHRGNGNVGPALCLHGSSGDLIYSHRRLGSRSLTTVFGTVELVRMGYSRPGAPSIFPLDQALVLPARSFSYELQRRLVKAAVQNPFLESVQTIAELTGVAVSTRAPWVRTPQQVVESLFPTRRRTAGDAPTPPRPENKRVWASLLKGKTAVIQEVAEEMQRRDPSASKTRVALTDGERALQIRVEGKLNVTLILDLMHALEKLWKAAYVFHPEGSLDADLWVLDRTLRILFGEVGQVVKGIRQSITKRGLAGAKRNTLLGVTGYLYRNRTRMRYDQYLANGWPIASGPVEGACKNLIKDRMERSGMRWTEQMAEAIVQLRAIYLSGDFDRYWQFHIEQDQRRLYPTGWGVVP